MNKNEAEIHQIVRDRYAQIARHGGPVPEAGACQPNPAQIAAQLGYEPAQIDAAPDGANLGVGCGAPLADAKLRAGETVLDLGSGAGFDALLAAREVGETGHVIGVDMTPEMIERARSNAHATGHINVEFRPGHIEALPVANASVDVVMSNCVINLVPDKAAVYREVARVLRPGGRMIVSDIVLDAPLPAAIADSTAALTGCVAGASLRPEYLRTIEAAGLIDIEVLHDKSFGEMAMAIVPDELISEARANGVDVMAVARSVRSLTIRARKSG